MKNIQNRFAGGVQDDVLTPAGNAQVGEMASMFRDLLAELGAKEWSIWSADSGRSLGTAVPLASALKVEVKRRSALRSIEGGPIAGMAESQAIDQFPDYMRALRLYRLGLLDSNQIPHLGESLAGFEERVRAILTEIELSGGMAIVVAHKSVITASLIQYARRYHGYPQRFYGFVDVPEASVSIVVLDGVQKGIIGACLSAQDAQGALGALLREVTQ